MRLKYFIYLGFIAPLNCQTYHEKEQLKIDSIVKVYQQKDKLKYLNLLPNVSYDLLNNSVNVGFSFATFSNYLQQKRRNKIQVEQLKARLNNSLDSKIERLEIKKEVFNISLNEFKNKLDLFEINNDLYKIESGKYKNSEITTEVFLISKKNFLQSLNNLKSSFYKLKLQFIKIQLLEQDFESSLNLQELENKLKYYSNTS